jgi:hypothetical protein
MQEGAAVDVPLFLVLSSKSRSLLFSQGAYKVLL